MKKALVMRPGAYGDVVIVTPVLSALKRLGYKVYFYAGKRGAMVVENNPNIDEFIIYEKEGVYNPDFVADAEKVKKDVAADYEKDFSESIEVNLALHPASPWYIYPKQERMARGGKNYYEETGRISGIDIFQNGKILPEIYLTDIEIAKAKEFLKPDKINILWVLSGSGANKVYPWTDYVLGEIIKNYDNVNFITVGDEKCKILEWYADDIIKEHTTNVSGLIDFRLTMALTSVVDLVISPDTGALHASGSFNTPKIGVLGHTTVENITKYFTNDYSLNADEHLSECAPCHRLIYDHKVQCPIDNLTGAAWCMAHGQPALRLYDQIVKALYEHGHIGERRAASRSPEESLSSLQTTNA